MFWIIVVALIPLIQIGLCWWVWRFPTFGERIDRRLAEGLRTRLSDFDEAAWNNGKVKRRHIYALYVFGVVLVILLPFGALEFLFHKCGHCPHWLVFLVLGDKPYEAWERAVCLWTLVFLSFFVFAELGQHIQAVEDRSQTPMNAPTIIGVAFKCFGGALLVLAVALVLIMATHHAWLRNIGELVVALALCYVDVRLYRYYKKQSLDKEADGFLGFLFLVDIPGLVALLAVELFLILRHGTGDALLPVAAGAAALNLALVNTIFSILYVWDHYRLSKSTSSASTVGIAQSASVAMPTTGGGVK